MGIQHQYLDLHDTAPSQLFCPIESLQQRGTMRPGMELESGIATELPSYLNPVTLEGYPQIQTPGVMHPCYEEPPHPLQASEIIEYPDIKNTIHTTELGSKAPQPRRSHIHDSLREHGNQP